MAIRVFIAVEVRCSDRLMLLLSQLRSIGSPVRAVAAANMHLTLRFLGSIDETQIEPITSAVAGAAGGVRPFDFDLCRVGAFPNERRPAVIWVGVDDGGRFAPIVARLNARLADLGISAEDRPWHPHITVARIKARPPQRLHELIRQHRGDPFGPTRVERIELIRSDLSPAGPTYTPLSQVPLAE